VRIAKTTFRVRDEGRVTNPIPARRGPALFCAAGCSRSSSLASTPSQRCCPRDVGAGVRVLDEPTPQRQENSARRNHRLVIMTTCEAHGAVGFTNLLVTKENGVIVLNPHLANCCVLRLNEQAARALHGILGEWLG
jgi:hypothetical protein